MVNGSARSDQPYDLIVIGAGVNGLGVARDAARRGLRVIVLEQDDICSGVSAWSGVSLMAGSAISSTATSRWCASRCASASA